MGEDMGITPGMAVISEEGVAVGIVARVFVGTAVVSPFSAAGFRWYAVVDTPTPVHIELEGLGSGSMRAFVPRDVALSTGQSVLLPNLPGNVVGVVTAIDLQPEDAYQTVYVRIAVNPRHLRFVLVDTAYVWRPGARDETVIEFVKVLNEDTSTRRSVQEAGTVQ
jgi:cell shape-determining protein MreC